MSYCLDQGWPEFFARGPNSKSGKCCGPQKEWIYEYLLACPFKSICFYTKLGLITVHHLNLLQGQQEIVGGPHAGRGPQFGHVWSRPWVSPKFAIEFVEKCHQFLKNPTTYQKIFFICAFFTQTWASKHILPKKCAANS